jgi:hypothetical protein
MGDKLASKRLAKKVNLLFTLLSHRGIVTVFVQATISVLWIRNDFFKSVPDSTFQIVPDPAPDPNPVSDPT